MVVDSILIISHFYFNNTKRKFKKLGQHFRKYEPLVYFTLFVLVMDILVAYGVQGMYELKFNGSMADYCPSEDVPDSKSWQSIMGTILVYAFQLPAYSLAKPGQLWKNYKTKSTEGLSFFFVICTCVGNLTQMISLLMASFAREDQLK